MDFETQKGGAAVPQQAHPEKEAQAYFMGGHKRE
jgi:hypothetical protein